MPGTKFWLEGMSLYIVSDGRGIDYECTLYACARTALVTLVQLSRVVSSIVGPKVTPSIVTFWLSSIPNGVVDSDQAPTDIAFEF
jgi:hypothetical protein